MTEGIHWVIRTEDQKANLIQVVYNMPMPFMAKIGQVVHPKTQKQLNYCHSLCNALAAHHRANPEEAKKDAKVAFGVVIVSTSLVTGERTARLKSFSDYTKEELTAFCTSMEVHLTENGIDFIPSDSVEGK